MLTMEEEVDHEEEQDVNSVLAQVFTELAHILSCESPGVIMKLCNMVPSSAQGHMDQLDLTSASAVKLERVTAMLEYFRTGDAVHCRTFLQALCILSNNIPMHLESRLMSVAGPPTRREPASVRVTDGFESSSPSSPDENLPSQPSEQQATKRPRIDGFESSSPSSPDENLPSQPSEQQATKRPRIDHWGQYNAAARTGLRRRWDRLSAGLVREVQLEDVWVRQINRAKERPDQTPGPGGRGCRTPDSDYGYMEAKVTLESFLQSCAGRVTVLLGQAGSGKTLLMSCLGQQWAQGLGPIPSSYLFVLLEFRQLNLVSHPLSLSELLFQCYLPPQGGDDEKSAVLDYLLSNPEQSCWMLDGYDEFNNKITRIETQENRESLDPKRLLPIADLISGLLSRQILPGCTLVVTCRARDVFDLEGMADNMGELLGWERYEVKQYVESYFQVKGHGTDTTFGNQAVDLLLSSQHLLAMSYFPALCNICCVCVEQLLQGRREEEEEEREQHKEEELRGTKETRADRQVDEERAAQSGGEERRGGSRGGSSGGEGSEDITGGGAHGGRGRGEVLHSAPSSPPQLPPSLTQVYLTVLGAFLSRGRATDYKIKTTAPPQSSVCLPDLGRYQSELCELSRLAWVGLEDSRILFKEQELPLDVLEFSTRAGLLTQVELRYEDGLLGNAYCFVHLTLQEFLAALRIMTSDDVTPSQLKKRFNLKTRWTTKSVPKTVFTDSVHLYVCGLASPDCTPALIQLASSSGSSEAQKWVQRRQALVLRLLKKLCVSNSLTGPKVLQLCHCVQETQDSQLAKEVVGTRPIFELRNIRLLPSDIDALAFVVGSVGDVGVGLDFGACSMELECLDVLPSCKYIHYLTFRGRKYDDQFAGKLSTVLPELQTLKKLEYTGASLTDVGAASLAKALQTCPNITEINLSDNSLTYRGIRDVVEIVTKRPSLASLTLSQKSKSLEAVSYLIKKMTSCVNIQHVCIDGMKEIKVTFYQSSDINGRKKSGPTVSLLNESWTKAQMKSLTQLLSCCPALSVLEMTGGQLKMDTLRTLVDFLPRLNITERIIVNDSGLSLEGLVVLTTVLRTCPAVVALNVRLQSPDQVSVVFSGDADQPRQEISRKLCLRYCSLLPAELGRVLRSLGPSPDLTILDLSSNSLGNKGLMKLLDVLSQLSNIQEINASDNAINMDGVVMLAGAFSSHHNLTEVHRDGRRDQVILKFCPDKSDEEQLKTFRLTCSSLPSDMTKLYRKLAKCGSPLQLDLSHNTLKDHLIKVLLKFLPKITSLERLNVSYCNMSTDGALTLVSCLIDNQRVESVKLRSQGESVIQFDKVKVQQVSCRLTQFTLSSENVERLTGILEQCPQLSDLDLSSNYLRDEGVRYFVNFLPRLQIIRSFNLSDNSLSQQAALEVASTLCNYDNVSDVKVSLGAEERCLIYFQQDGSSEKTLSVRDCCVEPDHVIRLAEILSECPTLTKLELSNNQLQPDDLQDLWRSLNSLPSLHTLESGHYCNILLLSLGLASETALLPSPLVIEESWMTSEAAVRLVCHCLDLNSNIHTIRVHRTTLHMSVSTGLTSTRGDATIPASSVLTEKIGLVDCAVEGRHLAAMRSIIRRCPLLTELDLSQNSLGEEGAEFLCSILPLLPNLTSLSLGSKETCADVVVQLAEALLHSTGLQHLNLSGHVISDGGAEILARTLQKLPCLRSLDFSRCCGWTATGGLELVRALTQCVRLEGLRLDSVPLDEDSMVCLAQGLRKTNCLRRLSLNTVASVMGLSKMEGILDLLAAMEGLQQMEEIELEGWRISDRGVDLLTRLLPLWTELRMIRLSNNSISDQSGEKLLQALRSCNQLEELHLSGNSLKDLTAATMAMVLPSVTHLTVLDISENNLGTEGSASLSRALVYMKNLTKLNLTSIGSSELCAVAASLAHCPLIQDVSLGWNGCGDDVAVELAKVLPCCQRLTRLDLESNSISEVGAEALVTALQSCPALQVIRLWRNKISESEALRLQCKDRRLNFLST